MELSGLITEGRPSYDDLDTRSVKEILTILSEEDQKVPRAVARVLPAIEQAVHWIVASFNQGGRLFYVGAGTSGRLGVLDAAECPPTFGVSDTLVQGIMAGGEEAFVQALEGVEDDREQGAADVRERGVTERDVVVGITASGRTPYVIGALVHARRVKATTIALVCNPGTPAADASDVAIDPVVGPEVIMGSTRLKAATAQKLVLNMLTTTAMIQTGKVYRHFMVDLVTTNKKLKVRARRIVQLATGCDEATAQDALQRAHGSVKIAIVMQLTGCTRQTAERSLHECAGFVSKAIALATDESL